jgi:hypothetical protein
MRPIVFAYVYPYPWVSLSLFTGYIFKVKTKGVLIKEWKNHKGSILVCWFPSIFGYFIDKNLLSGVESRTICDCEP